jgi:acetyl-CoA C-acetyltransferase
MGATAEVLAQIFRIDRGAQDRYAMESVRRAVAATREGFHSSHMVPVIRNGAALLDHDETPLHRSVILEKPRLMEKAPALFDNGLYSLRDFYRDNAAHLGGTPLAETSHGTVTLLNSCGRSDGAAGLIVTTAEKAKALGLEVLAEVAGWAFRGVEPERMGLAPAVAAQETLKRVGLSFDQLDLIELHEPFAASVLALFKFAKETFGHDWETAHAAGRINPKGGTLALGHPIAATGIRILLTLGYALKELQRPCWGLAGACASGGMGGAMVLRRPSA